MSRPGRAVAVASIALAVCAMPIALVVYLGVLAAVQAGAAGWPLADAAAPAVRVLESGTPRLSQVLVVLCFAVRPVLLGVLVVWTVRAARRPGLGAGRRAAAWALAALLVAELAMGFVPRSHGQTSLARINWHLYHQRTDARGFRDPGPKDADRLQVWVLGDSFTEGTGIADVADRYDRVLRRRLDPAVEVRNLGRSGAQTVHEIETFRREPGNPDVLVLQYFGNDILPTAAQETLFPECRPPFAQRHRHALSFSYLVNYVVNARPSPGYTDCVYSGIAAIYRDPNVLAHHLGDLDRLRSDCEVRGIDLVVLLIPFLDRLAESRAFADPVARFFRERGVEVVDVAALVRDLPPADRVVNATDVHASEAVHARMGERLAELLAPRVAGRPAGPR